MIGRQFSAYRVASFSPNPAVRRRRKCVVHAAGGPCRMSERCQQAARRALLSRFGRGRTCAFNQRARDTARRGFTVTDGRLMSADLSR
jgi:hypothetical protein